MNSIKKIAFVCMLCLTAAFAFARQANNPPADQTDFMVSNGKIYVVLAVVVTIVLGIFIYLFSLDRKIKRIEKIEKNN